MPEPTGHRQVRSGGATFLLWGIGAVVASFLGLQHSAELDIASVTFLDVLEKAGEFNAIVFAAHWWRVLVDVLKALVLCILLLAIGDRFSHWLCPLSLDCVRGHLVIKFLVGTMLLALLVLGCGFCG